MKSNRFLFVLILLIFCGGILAATKAHTKKERFSLTAYNFGSLGKLSPEEQIQTLKKTGYTGIILNSETQEDLDNLDLFFKETKKTSGFSVHAIMARYNFTDPNREKWKSLVDTIAGRGIELWIIFGKKKEGITDSFIEEKLREVVLYSAKKHVRVILYPHSLCYIASAEAALPFVEKINAPNLKLAIHLCHEIRAGNGNRMDEVFEHVKGKIGAVTLAGTDSVADFTSNLTMDKSTIKPIDAGNYDLRKFILPLLKSDYMGKVGFINFKIEENPETYLKHSIRVWESLLTKKN